MNIKSNKESESVWSIDNGKFIVGLVKHKFYWITILVWGTLTVLAISLDVSWGFHLILLIIAIIAHVVIVFISENNRVENERWNDRKANISIFSIVGIPLIMVGLSYLTIIKPMYIDYKTSERIDRVLPIEKVNLFYNDYNNIFILFVDGKKQPLVIDKGGASETYNRLKADYLDKKIKVIKKETKDWTEDDSSIKYYLDTCVFD